MSRQKMLKRRFQLQDGTSKGAKKQVAGLIRDESVEHTGNHLTRQALSKAAIPSGVLFTSNFPRIVLSDEGLSKPMLYNYYLWLSFAIFCGD
jgi:hypothetical protein